MKKKAVFNWSGGKDSALALHKILKANEYDIIALLTTVNGETERSSMHQIPLRFLQAQADSIGIPLYPVMLRSGGMDGYQTAMLETVEHFKKEGVKYFIFGDIFLDDVKSYREKQLAPHGIEVIEPLWNKTSEEVISEFLASGIRTKTVITQADKLGSNFVGVDLNESFIDSLPKDVDPCGENGEYHTFAYAGGLFRKEVEFALGKPEQVAYDVKMEDGSTQTFTYWHTSIN